MKLRKIISGGQTGADRGGLDAALHLGLERGGWCPKGRRAEDGVIPESYPLSEHESSDYPPRTYANVKESDATVIFTLGPLERGSELTRFFCEKQNKPWLHLNLKEFDSKQAASRLKFFLKKNMVGTLNVAGNRESRSPGIRARVEEVVLMAAQEEGK